MRLSGLLIVVAGAGWLFGCAATVPTELVSAREAYLQASAGPAAELAPAELHTAEVALAKAETSFDENSDSFVTRDLAYVAQRKAEMAEAQATIASARKSTAQSDDDFNARQGDLLQKRNADLTAARADLEAANQSSAAARQKTDAANQRTEAANQKAEAANAQLEAEKAARLAAEMRNANALADLQKLAAVKEDERGMVVTLSGSVLFRSGDATLLPGAEAKLSQVADALSAMDPRDLVVEGHTDSQGSDQFNRDLAQRRADNVRSYLVAQGYPASKVQALGIGEGNPVADNASSEGRANNRRVEIVIRKEASR